MSKYVPGAGNNSQKMVALSGPGPRGGGGPGPRGGGRHGGGHHGGHHGHHGRGRGGVWFGGYPGYGWGYDYPSSEVFVVAPEAPDDEETILRKLALKKLLGINGNAKALKGLGGLMGGPAVIVRDARTMAADIAAQAAAAEAANPMLFGYPRKTVLLLGGGVVGLAALLLLKKRMKKSSVASTPALSVGKL